MSEKSSSSDNESKNSFSYSSSENNSKRNKKKKNDDSLKGNNIEEEQLTNYYSYIDKCLVNLEEKRQNYVNNLDDIKSRVEEIKTKKINNLELTKITFDECIKLLDEHYSLFTEVNQILLKFNELNDSAQNIYKYYKDTIYCNDMHEEVKEELQQKIQENENLRSTIKELKKMKNNDEDEKEDNYIKKNDYKANTEMKSRINNLLEENNELKRKYSQVMTESKLFKDYVEQKYISKQESTRRMSTLISKIDIYENEIGKLQNKINEIETEKNNEIPNEDEKEKEKEKILDNQSYLSENSSIKQGINLEDLLENENEEEEEYDNNNKLEKKSIYNKSPKSIKKHKNSDFEKKSINKSPKSIKKHKNSNLEKKSIYSKSPKSIKNQKNFDIEKKSNLFILCPMSKMKEKKEKLNNLKIYKSPFSHISCSSYSSRNINAKRKKNAKSVKSIKIINKEKEDKDDYNDKKEINQDYNKIYFYLLLKSIIMNNKLIEYFKKSDYEYLYDECQKEEIPFNQFQDWILNKIDLKDQNYNDNYIDSYYYDDSNINNCFICTSMI